MDPFLGIIKRDVPGDLGVVLISYTFSEILKAICL